MAHTENEHMNHDSTNQWTNESMNQWISESRNQWIVVLPDTLVRFWVVYNPRFYLVFWDLPTTWKLKLDASWGGLFQTYGHWIDVQPLHHIPGKTPTNKQASKQRKKERNLKFKAYFWNHIRSYIHKSHTNVYIYIYMFEYDIRSIDDLI